MTDNDHKASWEESLEHLRKERTQKPEHGSQRKNNPYLSQFDAAFDAASGVNSLQPDAAPPQNNIIKSPTPSNPNVPPLEKNVQPKHTPPQKENLEKETADLIIEPVEPLGLNKARSQSENEDFYTYDTLDADANNTMTIDVTAPEFSSLSLGKNESEQFLSSSNKDNDEIISSLTISAGNEDILKADNNIFADNDENQDNSIEFSFGGLSEELEIALPKDIEIKSNDFSFENEIKIDESTINILDSKETSPLSYLTPLKRRENGPVQEASISGEEKNHLDLEPVEVSATIVDDTNIDLENENTEQTINITPPETLNFDNSKEPAANSANNEPFINPSIFSIPIFSIDRNAANKDEEKLEPLELEIKENKPPENISFVVEETEENIKEDPLVFDITAENETEQALEKEIFLDAISPIFTIDEDPDFSPEDNEINYTVEEVPHSEPEEEITYCIDDESLSEEKILYSIDNEITYDAQVPFEEDLTVAPSHNDEATVELEPKREPHIEIEKIEISSVHKEPQPCDLSHIILQDHVLDALVEKLAPSIQETILASIQLKLNNDLADLIKETLKEHIKNTLD